MLAMGIDPGTARTGYGLVKTSGGRLREVKHGVIVTPPDWPTARRLTIIHQQLAALIAEHNPAVVGLEEVFFGRNAPSALTVGEARGVAILAAGAAGVAVMECTPAEVKQAVTGYGKADKQQVKFMVRAILGLGQGELAADAADALATAICCLHHYQGGRPA